MFYDHFFQLVNFNYSLTKGFERIVLIFLCVKQNNVYSVREILPQTLKKNMAKKRYFIISIHLMLLY